MSVTTTSPTGLTERLGHVCGGEPVALAYLFGSAARGTMDGESDINMAVLVDGTLSKGG